MELASRIRPDFVYDPEATEVSTPAQAAFAQRRGVCQDFANIMIAALRGLGLPALYVSGYIRTIPPPGKKATCRGRRLARLGRAVVRRPRWAGWTSIRPTRCHRSNDHIEVARGRDYSDASPIESMVLSSGCHPETSTSRVEDASHLAAQSLAAR